MKRRLQIVLLAGFFWLLFGHGTAEAQGAKRLMLKDGSYQMASQWEVNGERVRYFSSERNEWEEVPASMVDWQATENFEKQRASQRQLDLKPSEEEDEEEARAAPGPTIAPGLHLPSSGGVYLLDSNKGELQLTELTQSSGEVSRQSGHGLLRGAFGSKQSIELKGEHARAQAHLGQTAIFIDIDQEPGGKSLPLAERFRITRLESKKDARVVGNVKVAVTGRVNEQEIYLAAAAEQLPGGWVKLTPSQTLSAGEYAVVEMLDLKTMNSYVWDFGVNPTSQENPGVWKAAPDADTAAPSGLEKRPQ